MPVVTQDGGRIDVRLKVKSIFDKSINANNVVIKIPCPKNTASVSTNTLVGKAKYEPESSAVVWRIKKFAGEF